MKLTKAERIGLIHQHQILLALNPEEAEYHEKSIEILRNGYEFQYSTLYEYIYDGDDIMSEEECQEVWDTLSMFDSIDRTITHLEKSHDDFEYSRFFGYDGNGEGKFLGFVEFTITKDRRFSNLPIKRENYFNSHMPARDIYKRMLDQWKKINYSNRFPMGSNDLLQVLEAAVHPSNS